MGITFARYRDDSETQSRLLRSIIMIRSRNICNKCNVQFKSKITLDEHIQRFHPKDHYTCSHCNLVCWTWSTFEKHIYITHNDMIFCSYCYKAFSNYSNLHRHWRTHEPYECEICNDTFITLSDLRGHHGTVHRDVPFRRVFPFLRFIR